MLDMIAWFFGGAFLVNAIPHSVCGVCGRPFPSPFAKPPGRGNSPPLVNVLWGFANVVVGYGLIFHVGGFNLQTLPNALVLGCGMLVMALFLAAHFGKVREERQT